MLTFSTFARWTAVSVDGHVWGYLEDNAGSVTLHVARNAPAWLRGVRGQGPWPSTTSAQQALTDAAPRLI